MAHNLVLPYPCPIAGAHCKRGQLRRGAVDDEEKPKELVQALHNHVLPHAPADERFVAPVRLLQQQVWRRHLCRQRCTANPYQVQCFAINLNRVINMVQWEYWLLWRQIRRVYPCYGRCTAGPDQLSLIARKPAAVDVDRYLTSGSSTSRLRVRGSVASAGPHELLVHAVGGMHATSHSSMIRNNGAGEAQSVCLQHACWLEMYICRLHKS